MQIVECNALPTLILMLQSEDAAIHYEAVSSDPSLMLEPLSMSLECCCCVSCWNCLMTFEDLSRLA